MPASSQQHPVGVQGHQAMIESPQTEDTLVSQNDGQLKLSAGELLLQQLTTVHTQLRAQEKLTNEVLAEKRILEEKVKRLELQLEAKARDLTGAGTAQDRNVSAEALEETRIGGKEADAVDEKVLQERATISCARKGSQGRTDSATTRTTLRSRRPYVCVIIDGDANHFLPALLQAGARGGEVAAERVKQEVSQLIAERPHIPDTYALKVQVFMNRQGYVDTIIRYDKTPKDLIDSCLDRFVQSQPTWDLVDTGGLRESADTKVKANFNFFIEDSDCFAMILGVCSDNGYVQMLQPFQGNPQKMSKIILLASYNTTSDIQGLTYAIVQWPTVFRSQMASKTTCYGLAGVRTKDVTPLEDVLRIEHSSIPSSVERLTEVSVAPEIPRRKKGKKQSQIPPNAPQSPATRRVPVSTKFEVREPQSIPQRHGSRLDIQQDMRPCAKDRRRAKAKPLVDNIIPRSTPGLHMPSTSDLSEEPDHELTHPLDLPAPPRMPPRGPGTSILGLSSTLHGVLPFAASVARRVTCGATCPLLIAAPKLLSPVLKPQQSTKTDLDASTSDNEEPFGSSSDTPFRPQSFTHIPKPNRAESHIYDPDRFLYQQSPEYLQFNKAFLEEIIRYAKNHQATVPESQLRELKIRLQIAQFLLTRLTLALEIQSLEDEAAARGILWPLPSQDGRKDRFTSDWELYRKLSNRLDRGVREDVRLPQMTMESRLARLDYQNIAVI